MLVNSFSSWEVVALLTSNCSTWRTLLFQQTSWRASLNWAEILAQKGTYWYCERKWPFRSWETLQDLTFFRDGNCSRLRRCSHTGCSCLQSGLTAFEVWCALLSCCGRLRDKQACASPQVVCLLDDWSSWSTRGIFRSAEQRSWATPACYLVFAQASAYSHFLTVRQLLHQLLDSFSKLLPNLLRSSHTRSPTRSVTARGRKRWSFGCGLAGSGHGYISLTHFWLHWWLQRRVRGSDIAGYLLELLASFARLWLCISLRGTWL